VSAPSGAAATVREVGRLEFDFEPWAWPFATVRRGEIDAHFAAAREARPQLFNGRVLLLRSPRHEGDIFRASYFETDFASFLAWRDWGFPGSGVYNGFGMGALRGNDGIFVLGEMAAHTANAGRVYFPSGTPEPRDVARNRVDMTASVIREVEEETGLKRFDYRTTPRWHCVEVGQLIALMRRLDVVVPAPSVKRRIEGFLKTQKEPELAAVHLVRDRRDFTAAMPPFVTAYIEAITE
jgi:8-oxo-dGTP pyrophosphatase MutT (NUDIX family)